MPWFETLDQQVVHEGWATVRIDTVRMPDGSTADREVVDRVDAVAAVPLLDDGDVLLLRQYRHPLGQYVLEIPAGIMDVDGEAPIDTARRELAEEIGMGAADLRPLTTFANSAGWCTEHTHVFLATGLSEVQGHFEAEAEEADMEIVRLPLADAVAAVEDGTIVDAKTIIGLLLAARL
jgi:ADP-ribose pyrophosphatase